MPSRARHPAPPPHRHVVRLGEINLFVRDLARSRAFYEAALGFEVSEVSEPPGSWLKLGRDGIAILLFCAPPTSERCAIEREPGMSADLIVDDFEHTQAALRQAGAEFGESGEGGGYRFVVFYDPDGIRWELLGRLS